MDTANFLIERQEIENRMDARRAETSEQALAVRSGILPWMLLTGASMVSGFRSSPGAKRLLRTLVWAAAAPLVVGFMNRHNDGLVHRLVEALFPSAKSKETAHPTNS